MDQKQLHGTILRIGTYLFLVLITMAIAVRVLLPLTNPLVASVCTIFLSALVANLASIKIYERGHLQDIGLRVSSAGWRNLGIGLAGGIGAALLVLVLPLLADAAELVPDTGHPADPPTIVFLFIVAAVGVMGEEMLFRGYLFQVLLERMGVYATIVPFGMLFGLGHAANPGANGLSVINTVLWGVVLGYAFVRSGDLWLPIGLHYGWNIMLPLFGVKLSGFELGVTGYVMHWKASGVWSGEGYGPEAGILTMLVLPLIVWFLLRAPVQRQAAVLAPTLIES